MKNKILLTILDGWGYTEKHPESNALEVANPSYWQKLLQNNLKCFLATSGEDVGLPHGQMGNSEVGHTNIGAGRIVYQDLPKITKAMNENIIETLPQIVDSIKHCKEHNCTMHIAGLYSDGGVHSHYLHYLHCVEIFAKHNIKVVLHIFTDGRDTPPNSAVNFIAPLNALLSKYPTVTLGTVGGRYFAMDRDNRWERIEKSYNAMVSAQSPQHITNLETYLKSSYANGTTDEFIEPAVFDNYKGMNDGDCLTIINFRNDRVRQLLNALLFSRFDGFSRTKVVQFATSLGMVEYSDQLRPLMKTLFYKQDIKNTLGEHISNLGLKQLRVAETEKYPHVTFFFNGGQEVAFAHEDRVLIPSPKVATYDLKPEMSANEITDALINNLNKKEYSLIVANYANGDMVGHTGNLKAAVSAVNTVDLCLERLHKSVLENDYIWLIIADHGNCEEMWDYENNSPHTQHTTNVVYGILTNFSNNTNITNLKNGKLADVAVTILDLLNIETPKDMNGESLLVKKD